MALKPWYRVATPREDLREGKPLDASEFAVHLDQVRDGRAPAVYQDPRQFFERTYLTQNLTGLAAEVIRRLSGEKTETSAVFNMTTQFGGGKTHALTLLYHLAKHGPEEDRWPGVKKLLERAGIPAVPKAATAVFVGTEFDSITGRGGDDGTPLRKTPWGEVAYQLGGEKAFAVVAEHEKQMTAPAGDVLRKFLPKDKPCLILLDELMNYVSRSRKSGMATQLYNFLQNLSEESRGCDNVVLAVSIPASELEMSAEDQSDYERFKKLLDRLGKAVFMSAETETSEIIRRRLFEWNGVPEDGKKVVSEYADWVVDHRQQIPNWFPIDNTREAFEATYPFHPMALSVFERKWRALPRFQETRGILRLLALWVSRAYPEGYKGNHRDPLIGLGTAPLDDPIFRAATFEQLGEPKLAGAVTTDICGKKDAHAVRLDKEAVEAIKKARLHRKVATTIFFESNGGQSRTEATIPEIRLSVAEPDLDIGNVETVLESLTEACYYLTVERNHYHFSFKENLNKRFADRRASIQLPRIDELVRDEVRKVFAEGTGMERVFFPEKSSQISDRPVLTLVVLSPDRSMAEDQKTLRTVEAMTRECGNSARTFKSALVWMLADTDAPLREETRKVLAWEAIQDEEHERRRDETQKHQHLDETQKKHLSENVKKAWRDLRECVWRTYKNMALLGKDNAIRVVDLGLVHSSAADTLVTLIVNRLRQDGDLEKDVSPNFLVRNWPPAFKEWSTKAVRDAFFASPQFPRLLSADAVKETIARGVSQDILAYVGKRPDGRYDPFVFERKLTPLEVEISDDVFILTAEEAKKHIEPPNLVALSIYPQEAEVKPGGDITFQARGVDQHGRPMGLTNLVWSAKGGNVDDEGRFKAGKEEGEYLVEATSGGLSAQTTVTITTDDVPPPPPPPPPAPKTMRWTGEVPPQKWMNFYTKVLSKFAREMNLKISIQFEVTQEDGVSPQKIQEARTALRELGLGDDVGVE